MNDYLLVWVGAIVGVGILTLLALAIFHFFKFFSRKVNEKYPIAGNTDRGEYVVTKILRTFPLPKPTEASLFVSALVLFLIVFTYNEFWEEVMHIGESEDGGGFYFILIYIFFGAVYSIFHAFSNKPKTDSENKILRFFAVTTLAGASFSSAIYIFNTKEFGFIIFSIVNILQALHMLLLSGKKYLGDRVVIPNRNADRIEILLGTLLVFAVFGIEKYVYDTHWSIVFSFTLFCWSIVASFLQKDESVL